MMIITIMMMMMMIIIIIIITSFKNKAGSTAVATHSDTRGLFLVDSVSPLLFCIAFVPLTHELNRADCVYQVHGTERKISHLMHAAGLKLPGRNGVDLENGIKIVTAISKDINMNFGLEKCAKICL